jgi:hypothetical protein
MLKLLKRSLSALLAATAAQPVARAVMTGPSAIIETDADAALKAIKYDHQVQVRPEYLKNYQGEKTFMSDDLIARVTASKRFRNGCITASQETDEFVKARTR